MNQLDLNGRHAIVTGGAAGLGLAITQRFLASGAQVTWWDRDAATMASAQKALGPLAGKVQTVVVDVSEHASVVDAVRQTVASRPQVDALVNCAGICPAEKTVGKNGAHNLGVFAKVISVNLVGTFNMIRLAAQAMAQNDPESTGERGCIVSTASVAAYDGQMGQAAYSASKGGVVGMTLPSPVTSRATASAT